MRDAKNDQNMSEIFFPLWWKDGVQLLSYNLRTTASLQVLWLFLNLVATSQILLLNNRWRIRMQNLARLLEHFELLAVATEIVVTMIRTSYKNWHRGYQDEDFIHINIFTFYNC